MTELKPCPFCGHKPWINISHLYGALARYEVECPFCRVKKWSEIGLVDDEEGMETRKQSAIEAWNRRTGEQNETDRC